LAGGAREREREGRGRNRRRRPSQLPHIKVGSRDPTNGDFNLRKIAGRDSRLSGNPAANTVTVERSLRAL